MSFSNPDVPGTIVFDLDGVVYLGGEELPGAGEALGALAELGWRLVMATNNSSRTPEQVAAKISSLTAYAADAEQVVTSSLAAAFYIAGRSHTAMVVGEPALESAIRDAGVRIVEDWQDADTVVVGVDFDISYDTMDHAARAIRGGAHFVATNMDPTFPQPDGLSIGSGAIVSAIATASGQDPIVCGKPESAMRSLIRKQVVGSDVWVVGDRPETDIAMATAEGWRSILPLTGVTSSPLGPGLSHRPEFVVPTIADVPRVIAEHPRA